MKNLRTHLHETLQETSPGSSETIARMRSNPDYSSRQFGLGKNIYTPMLTRALDGTKAANELLQKNADQILNLTLALVTLITYLITIRWLCDW